MRRATLARVVATVAAAAVAGVTLSIASSGATLTAAQAAQAISGKVTVWGDAAPSTGAVDSDTDSVELGTPFTPTKDGIVLGVRFYKTAENTGTHVGNLWDGTGKRLASVTFTGETTKGWQTAYFDKPVNLKASSSYVASYLAPKGRYFQAQQFWSGSTTDLLAVPRGSSGVYSYGKSSAFPTKTWNRSQYWVDPVFAPSTGDAGTPTATPSQTPSSTPTKTPVPTPTATQTPTPTATPTATPKPTATPTATPKPTATPTPTPTTSPTTPPASNGFPSASTTGVPAGVALTPYTGPSRITQPGTVIDGKLITTTLVIAPGADNVTIRNSKIKAEGFWLILNDGGAKNLQIVDSEFDGMGNTANDSAVGGHNFTMTRVNIHGTVDGLKVGDNVTVQDTYIHDLVVTADSHNDGIQSLGSDDTKILHNTIIVGEGATSAIILSTGSADSMRRVTISGNLVGGGSYAIYGGYQRGTDDLAKVSDISISGNYFTTVIHPQSGAFGPMTSVDSPAVTVTNNYWYDGPKAGQRL
ncbi:DUF4082 domain-containing protein [Cellulomonas sp. ICMP 17802]|uniref:DUF4082 domain-containing protein n=1 Tax=Cellulomonas sp. ICMP 17802 TaxID=3239199 RepID=UPI00351B2E43